MKILLYSALLLVSLSTHATLQLVNSQITVNPIITQKAQESGVGFTSNSEQYQLIADGYAQQQNTVNIGSLSVGQSISTLWSSQRGPYQVFISSDSASQVVQSASASSSGLPLLLVKLLLLLPTIQPLNQLHRITILIYLQIILDLTLHSSQ